MVSQNDEEVKSEHSDGDKQLPALPPISIPKQDARSKNQEDHPDGKKGWAVARKAVMS